MKFILILFLIFSCTPNEEENPFLSEGGETKNNTEKVPSSAKFYKLGQMESTCFEGCGYTYKILKNAKSVNGLSISLTLEQIESIQSKCVKECLHFVEREPFIKKIKTPEQVKPKVKKRKEPDFKDFSDL